MNLEKLSPTCSDIDYSQVIADELDYRDYHVNFYEDPYGKQIFTFWKGNRIDFGTNNIHYAEDMKSIIDDDLDTITRFPELTDLSGAKLEKFQNGDYRDIRLVYRDRVLKIFLVSNMDAIDLDALISEACSILLRLRPIL